jgi:hypothetical protein
MRGHAARGANPTDTACSPAAALRTLRGDAVTIEGGLWVRRQATNRDAALPHGYRMLEAAGNLENLRIAAGMSTGHYVGVPGRHVVVGRGALSRLRLRAGAGAAACRPDGDPVLRLGESKPGCHARVDPAGYNLIALGLAARVFGRISVTS